MLVDGKGIEVITYIVVLVLYIRIKVFLRKKVSQLFHMQLVYTAYLYIQYIQYCDISSKLTIHEIKKYLGTN